MIAVLETEVGAFARLDETQTLESRDGERRAPAAVVLHDSWSPTERAAFGVYMVAPADVPSGKMVTGERFVRVDGEVVQQLDLADRPIVVPASVTPRQLRLALLGAGFLDDIDAFVASSAVPPAARIAWEYATEYRRDDPMLNDLAAQLDPPLSAEQIDQLFLAAVAK